MLFLLIIAGISSTLFHILSPGMINVDGIPRLDIKPYIENFDKIEGEVKNGWMQSSADEVSSMRSDERFI